MSGFDEGPRWPERDLDREPPQEPTDPEPWRNRWRDKIKPVLEQARKMIQSPE